MSNKRSEPRFPTLPGLTPEPEAAPPAPAAAGKVEAEDDEDGVARFEQDMQELEGIVARMEQGELLLEESLALFERGTQLARSCRKSLDSAELRVRQLLDEQDAGDEAE